MDVTSLAALIYAAVTIGVAGFQLALAAGAPWGSYAMGGKFPGRYPASMRVAAVGQAILLALIAVAVLARAGVVATGWSQPGWAIWAIVGFNVVSVILNAITPSAAERRVWLPVSLVLLAASVTVAISTV